jgi:hypothetical protein
MRKASTASQRMTRIYSRPAFTLLIFVSAGLMSVATAQLGAAPAKRTLSIPQAELQEKVAKKFPYQQRVADVLDLQVMTPRLALLPASNRLSTEVDLAMTERFQGRRYTGSLSMDYGLRFEPSDNSVRMTGVRVSRVDLADVPEPYLSLITQNAPRLAERLFDDYALHRFSAQDLSLVNGLGYVPGEIKVTPRGLSVTLEPATISGQPQRPTSSLPPSSGASS